MAACLALGLAGCGSDDIAVQRRHIRRRRPQRRQEDRRPEAGRARAAGGAAVARSPAGSRGGARNPRKSPTSRIPTPRRLSRAPNWKPSRPSTARRTTTIRCAAAMIGRQRRRPDGPLPQVGADGDQEVERRRRDRGPIAFDLVAALASCCAAARGNGRGNAHILIQNPKKSVAGPGAATYIRRGGTGAAAFALRSRRKHS